MRVRSREGILGAADYMNMWLQKGVTASRGAAKRLDRLVQVWPRHRKAVTFDTQRALRCEEKIKRHEIASPFYFAHVFYVLVDSERVRSNV